MTVLAAVSLESMIAFGLLLVIGLLLALGGLQVIGRTLATVPLFRRQTLGRLSPGKRVIVEGYARGEPQLQAPLTAEPCLGYEIVGFFEQQSSRNRIWVRAPQTKSEGQPFVLENEGGNASLEVRTSDFSVNEFGEPDYDEIVFGGAYNPLHAELGLDVAPRVWLKQWRIKSLEQCTIIGRIDCDADGRWFASGPDGGRLIVIAGSAATATAKVIKRVVAWSTLALFGLGVIALAIVMLFR